MNDRTRQNLENRYTTIKAQLGMLAYNRRDYELKIEGIDEQVAQMEAQGVVIEATLNDLNSDTAEEEARLMKEKADTKAKRSERAKTAAAKRKREKAKAEGPPEKSPTGKVKHERKDS